MNKEEELALTVVNQGIKIKELEEELEHYKVHDDDLIKLVTTHQLVSVEEYQKLKEQAATNQAIVDRTRKYVNEHDWVKSVLQYQSEKNFVKFHKQLKSILGENP